MNHFLPKSTLPFLRISCGQFLAFFLLIGMCHSSFAQSFTNQTSLLSNTDFHSGVAIGIADMNGDEKDDIIHLSEGKNLHVEYQQAANAPFTTYSFGDISSNREWSLCIADADKNGFNDILTGGAYNNIKLLKANATGSAFTLSNLPSSNIFLQGSNFVDIDNDGWADIFACHDDDESRSYRNTGNGDFVFDDALINTTLPSGNSGNYASIWTDYDNDGDLDMYLSKCRQGVTDPTDPRRVNLLFQNDGTNNFTEVATAANLQFGDQSWSADFADIDNDGDLDFFVLNHYTASLLMENNGDGTFTDITAASGMAPDLELFGIQSIFRDFDNDGFMDLLVSGTEHRLFKNNGDNTFTNLANPFTTDWIESFAIGDLNRDGFLDIYAGYAALFNTPTDKGDILFMNDGNDNNFFSVLLEGTVSNVNGIGARVELYGDWGIQIREVRSGEGYGIMNSFNQHFGLGTATEIDKIVVKWPSGIVDSVLNPTINQFFNLTEDSTEPEPADQTITFGPITDKLTIENPFGITATASSGLPVSFAIVSGPASIVGGNIVLLDGLPGTVVVRANQAGNADFNPALDVDQIFEVVPADQTISFTALEDKLTIDTPFSISATANSGLDVSYTILSGPATISGNTITLNGTAGTVSVQASQAGNIQYNPATNVVRNFNVIEDAPTSYCDASGEQPWQEWITNVALGDIDNTTGKTPYGDYTDLSTDLSIGATYPISLSPGFSWAIHDEYFRVWIDYNQDNDFTDADELVFEGFGQSTLTGNVVIPASANLGTTRMRVAMQRDNYASSCGTFELGEVEDYSVNIINNGPVLSLSCPANMTLTAEQGATSASVIWDDPNPSTTCTDGAFILTQTSGPSSGSDFATATVTTIEYEAIDNCENEETCSFTITVLEDNSPPGEYCEALGEAPWIEWIENVTFNTIDNTSAKERYGDFTDQITNLDQGGSYAIELTHRFSWDTADEYFSVWIDWNQDSDFTDAGEEVLAQISLAPNLGTTVVTITGNINVPASALTGTTRMRVAMKRGAYAGPCETFPNGEVEDYSVNIVNNGPLLSINCPDNISTILDLGNTEAVLSWDAATATSTCPTGTVGVTQTAGPLSGASLTEGSYTVTYEAVDNCSNIETCSFSITVNSEVSSLTILTCPNNINVTAVSGSNTAIANWTEPTGTTTCTDPSILVNQTIGLANGSAFPLGTTEVTYELSDNCGNLETCTFYVNVAQETNPGEYCEATGEQPWQEWIGNVTFAGINNDSGKDLYGDYTAIVGSVNQGDSYPITLQVNFSWTHHEEYFRVWIDYNQDGDFADVGEEVLSEQMTLGTPPNLPPAVIGNIVIPESASQGTTRMRIAMQRDEYADPCGTFVIGEVEDYTIVINPLSTAVIIEPIADFLRFDVLNEGRSIRLNWVTNAEYKNEYFEVEHSTDGRNFELLETVNSLGDSRLPTHYDIDDTSPELGENYYRLKEIYEDGSFKYSEIQKVDFDVELEAVNIYPNPAQEVLYINLAKYEGKEGALSLVDLLGQELIRKDLETIDSRPVQIDLSKIKNGMYTISIQIKDRKRMAKKVMISRLY